MAINSAFLCLISVKIENVRARSIRSHRDPRVVHGAARQPISARAHIVQLVHVSQVEYTNKPLLLVRI